MREPPPLAVQVRHRIGKSEHLFSLDISFRIDRWPAVLFGPSGAGKSTLLRIIAGLEHANSARITLGDTELRHSETQGMVQMVSQRPALFPHLSAADNIGFGLRRLSSGERRSRVGEMLALLGAEKLTKRMPASLSGGEQQRIAIARALAPGPELLLLDEAFAGLDSNAKQEILGRLLPLIEQRGIASLYVTHELADAFALNPEVVVLNAGRVVAQGPAHRALAAERERLLTLLGAPANP
jgi:molybdate transport system ATP-binding protein